MIVAKNEPAEVPQYSSTRSSTPAVSNTRRASTKTRQRVPPPAKTRRRGSIYRQWRNEIQNNYAYNIKMPVDSLVPPMLVPSSLYTEEAKRDSTRIRIYNMVLQQIYNKVKAVARVPGNEKSLWYVVPEFIPGTPRFDIGDAILYIVWNLRNIGYTVEYTHPNLLFVSWRSHDEIYRKHESPLSQVLNAVRGAATSYKIPTSKPTIPTASAPMPEITKRKTPLKKTVEFKPDAEVIQPTIQPITRSLVMSATGGAGAGTPRLPGQLSERHVSFV